MYADNAPPARDVSPTVGLMPTMLLWLLGEMIDPSVSDPSDPAASPIAIATPLPELDPDGFPSGTYGFVHCPARPQKPEGILPRQCAHSERLALPRRIAPAARSLADTVASSGTTEPWRAYEPAVVFMPGAS